VLGEKIRFLLNGLKSIPFFSPVEFTVEANPESLSDAFLDVCRQGGVNRLSLGVQTFHEISRSAVNRIGDAGVLKKSLALASRYFPDALSVDLITGLPHQNKKIIIEDIKQVLDFSPSHISLYSLSVEKSTPLEEKIKNKKVILPDTNKADLLWLTGQEALLKAGFEHYEVSNFAFINKDANNRCLHNIRYWQMKSWLGSGPSASGTLIDEEKATALRYTFANSIHTENLNWGQEDINREQKKENNEKIIYTFDLEEIDRITLLKESLLMGFRYIDGPDGLLFKKRFNFTIEDCIPQTLPRWKEKDKMLFLNQFLKEAFEEIESNQYICYRYVQNHL